MKPFRHAYTTNYFYIPSCIYSIKGLTNSLQGGVEVVSGSIEDKDIIFCVGGKYIASYDISLMVRPKYTDLLFKTFEHDDLNTLKDFMSEEGFSYAVAEAKYNKALENINKSLKASLSPLELLYSSFIDFSLKNN